MQGLHHGGLLGDNPLRGLNGEGLGGLVGGGLMDQGGPLSGLGLTLAGVVLGDSPEQ